jgi:hypothetical protein
MPMVTHSVQEPLLPCALERQKIMEQAGMVLAEARSLLYCLDQTGGRLSPEVLELRSHEASPVLSQNPRLGSEDQLSAGRGAWFST